MKVRDYANWVWPDGTGEIDYSLPPLFELLAEDYAAALATRFDT